MINFKYFVKGFISVRGIDSPALALGASLIAIGAIYKNLGFSFQESFLSTLFTYGLPGETKTNMLETKKYISEVKFTTVQESGTAEIEGAPLYNLNKKKLSVYPAAKIDSAYKRHTDGSKKWMDLVESLQNK